MAILRSENDGGKMDNCQSQRMQGVDTLGQMAAKVATDAALTYLERHKALTLVNCDALSEHLRRCCRAALPQALADAKAALDCGMREAAIATFKASMVIAGIAAAKTVHFVAE